MVWDHISYILPNQERYGCYALESIVPLQDVCPGNSRQEEDPDPVCRKGQADDKVLLEAANEQKECFTQSCVLAAFQMGTALLETIVLELKKYICHVCCR